MPPGGLCEGCNQTLSAAICWSTGSKRTIIWKWDTVGGNVIITMEQKNRIQAAPIEVVGRDKHSKRDQENDAGQPMVYQIRIKGHLDDSWAAWFEGLTITLEDNGETLLTGPVVDQAALHGILKKVRDLGMPLLSVNSARPVPPDRSDVKINKQAAHE
jgi:hypothetical protein